MSRNYLDFICVLRKLLVFRSAVPNDWNGSAKVALMSNVRSERAWREVAAAPHDDAATVLATSLATLPFAMGAEFPRAMEFRRPGFDRVRHRN